MRLRPRGFRPRTGSHGYRAVRPRHTLRHTSLCAPDPVGMPLGDHDGLNRLAGLFSFAARSPHTVAHLPLRDGVPPDEGVGDLVDLVLAHGSLGLRPSQWPDLRRRPRQGTPLTVRTDEARTDEARTARDAPRGTPPPGGRAGGGPVPGATSGTPRARCFADAAGRGPYQDRVAEGRMAFPGSFPPLVDPPGGGHPVEVMICFKPCPPYAHFRPPGASASRPRRPAVAP
ncbi:hypothetical protein ABZV75_17830 [Streptomyces flaveolus]|uniref:hypothetical protein n=1 Tax=Streptomyces flaveolus TaxID=67297 RepID=UPI0033B4109F